MSDECVPGTVDYFVWLCLMASLCECDEVDEDAA